MPTKLGRRPTRVALFVGAALCAAGAPSLAQEAETHAYPACQADPTDGDIAAAKGAFQAGQASFNEADYDRAIIYWEDAFRRDCTAIALLLNLARAYELGGNRHQAIEALQTYLSRNPSSEDRDQITRRIDVLNEQIEKERAAAASALAANPSPSPQPAPAPPVPPPPPTDDGGAPPWLGPVILGGAGLLVAGVGVPIFLVGRSDLKAAEKNCPNRMCPNPDDIALGNGGRTRQMVGGLMMGGGLAMVAGAGVWYALTPQSEVARRWRLTPALSPSYSGLALSASF